MKIITRYANNPQDSKNYDTQTLRKHYHVNNLFLADEISLVYSHQDRIIFGGIMPTTKKLVLQSCKELAADYFLQRRELGVINIGGAGSIVIDGKKTNIAPRDGMYIGMGAKEVVFSSNDAKNPAKFYINSSPAHTTYPTVEIQFKNANPVVMGEATQMNKRTIYQYVHPKVCKSCQLVMGMTMLDVGSSWNTMPCHTHERRMEVYLYFDLAKDQAVFHLMGEKNETRHIVMKNEEAVISPSWSIHSGVGTSNYTFIWGMCGENQEFTDMDFIKTEELF